MNYHVFILNKKNPSKHTLGLTFEIVEFNVCFIFTRFSHDFPVKKPRGFNVINNFPPLHVYDMIFNHEYIIIFSGFFDFISSFKRLNVCTLA